MDAVLVNGGTTTIKGVLVAGTFRNKDGQMLEIQRTPVETVLSGATSEALFHHPVAPNQQRRVRLIFTHFHPEWNKYTPSLKVAVVTSVAADPKSYIKPMGEAAENSQPANAEDTT